MDNSERTSERSSLTGFVHGYRSELKCNYGEWREKTNIDVRQHVFCINNFFSIFFSIFANGNDRVCCHVQLYDVLG